MCGIAGILTFDGTTGQPAFAAAVRQMTALMQRRGPDDEGSFASDDGRLQMGFRRLSILDLTAAGHRPMISGDGRSAIVFNGQSHNPPDGEAPLKYFYFWGI